MIYLYCVLRATSEPPAHLLGIDGAPVRAVDAAGLGAWVSDTAATTIVASPQHARAHDRVVRTALERETPLPARFGQIVADESALTALVSSRRAAFESALERVTGMIEMTVRVLLPVGRAPAASSGRMAATKGRTGRDYLQHVAASQREERNLLAENSVIRERVNSAVRGLVRAESFAGATLGSRVATVSHLVPRESIDEYRSALLVLRSEQPALAIMVSGPWAPYSFTEAVGA